MRSSKKRGCLPARDRCRIPTPIKTECVATPTRQFRYLMNNYELMRSQNYEICHLPPLDHEFLETFFAGVQKQKVTLKKRKTMDPIESILSAV